MIFQVEYRNEKANSAVALAEQEKRAKKEFIERLDGAQWKDDKIDDAYNEDNYIEVSDGKIYYGWIVNRLLNTYNDKLAKMDIHANQVRGTGFCI